MMTKSHPFIGNDPKDKDELKEQAIWPVQGTHPKLIPSNYIIYF